MLNILFTYLLGIPVKYLYQNVQLRIELPIARETASPDCVYVLQVDVCAVNPCVIHTGFVKQW